MKKSHCDFENHAIPFCHNEIPFVESILLNRIP